MCEGQHSMQGLHTLLDVSSVTIAARFRALTAE